ncbi:MAG: PKD domain-containing protein [Bacteroidales bacterium]
MKTHATCRPFARAENNDVPQRLWKYSRHTKHLTIQVFCLLLVPLFLYSCKKDDFPVPPASTVPKFSYTADNDGFAPSTVSFTNESITPEAAGEPSFLWNFGDSTSSSGVNPVHLFDSAGVYTVTLVVTMSVSKEVKEYSMDILIKNANATGIPVYFTNGTLVFSGFLNEDPPVFSALPIGPFQDSYGLAFDTVHSKLYISDFDAKKIFQCDPDGKNIITFRSNLLGPDGLAIDYQANQLYWDTDDGIQRANLSDNTISQVEDFVTGQANDPEGVSIDPVNRKLYWACYNGGVWSKNLDGTNEKEIIPAIEGGSTMVAGDRIYFDQWVATGDIHLKSAKLDGSGISTITTGISKVVFGIGYEPDSEKIYWGDRNVGKIMRADLDGSNIESWYTSPGSSPRGIVFGVKK